jgi:hypothetical protein
MKGCWASPRSPPVGPVEQAATIGGGSTGPPQHSVVAAGPLPAGVDGEALMLDPPLNFVTRHHALRVRLPPHHPGASPSAAQPATGTEGLRMLIRIAGGGAGSDAVSPDTSEKAPDPDVGRPGH